MMFNDNKMISLKNLKIIINKIDSNKLNNKINITLLRININHI